MPTGLDHNHHTDSDDDDGNQRSKKTVNELSNENSVYIVFWTIFQKEVVIFIVDSKWKPVFTLKYLSKLLAIWGAIRILNLKHFDYSYYIFIGI